MAIKPVKNFNSSQTGAPVLSGTAGALIAVLDACLVNGFNLITLDSLVVSNGVLTGTKAGHGYQIDQVIATTANEAALTGEWTVTSVTSNTFTCDATGISNVTGTGTISAKAAPAGWEKVYSGTNKAVYRSKDVIAVGQLLRVDDTGTTNARVVGYESMTDVDTGVGPFPTNTQVSGGGWWGKSNTANTTSRRWDLYADSLRFIYNYCPNSDPTVETYDAGYFFGQYTSEKQGDAFCTLLIATDNNYVNSGGYTQLNSTLGTVTAPAAYSPRSHTQIGTACVMTIVSMIVNASGQNIFSGSSSAYNAVYPSPASGGLIITKPCVIEGSTTYNTVRSTSLPGVFHLPQNVTSIANRTVIRNTPAAPGRNLRFMSTGSYGGTPGRVLIDITGPWE